MSGRFECREVESYETNCRKIEMLVFVIFSTRFYFQWMRRADWPQERSGKPSTLMPLHFCVNAISASSYSKSASCLGGEPQRRFRAISGRFLYTKYLCLQALTM